MRAIHVTKHGGPEVLELQDVPDPTPGPGELLVDVEAIGVNYRDVYEQLARSGRGVGHVLELEHLRPAVLRNVDCAHAELLPG